MARNNYESDKPRFVVIFFIVEKDNIEFRADGRTQITTTIVTAFFPFPKAKQSLTKYKEWLENLLSYTENPMVIFTSKNMSPLVESLRNARCKPNQNCFPTVIIRDFDTQWKMPPIKQVKDARICCIAQSI
jgi:hypothetical protein